MSSWQHEKVYGSSSFLHTFHCVLQLILTQKSTFESQNWPFSHFYVTQLFSADATICRNSNFVLAYSKWKHEKNTLKWWILYQTCISFQYRQKQNGSVCPESWNSHSFFIVSHSCHKSLMEIPLTRTLYSRPVGLSYQIGRPRHWPS